MFRDNKFGTFKPDKCDWTHIFKQTKWSNVFNLFIMTILRIYILCFQINILTISIYKQIYFMHVIHYLNRKFMLRIYEKKLFNF